MPDSPVLVITGASTGMGAATARIAGGAGYRLVLAARTVDRLSALAEETGGLAVPTDVSVWKDNEALVAQALERYGRIDAVFVNAGFTVDRQEGTEHPERWLNESVEQWRDMVLTNVLGAALTARAALPALKESRGHLVITSSMAGRKVGPGSLYSCTESAVSAMGESLRQDLHGTGVRVTVIEPGATDTPFFTALGASPADALTAEDIGRTVLFVLEQPAHVDINEILIRPTSQAY
jgi:NADP-dependent 3-hydroxy acid dehydrogenase YdfG